MTDDATPAKVRLTDELGPLPEPAIWQARDALWPLATLMKLKLHNEAAGLFTAEQMFSYAAQQVAAARTTERCKVCDSGNADLMRVCDNCASEYRP